MSVWRKLRRKLPIMSRIYALREEVSRLRAEVESLQMALFAIDGVREAVKRLERRVEDTRRPLP